MTRDLSHIYHRPGGLFWLECDPFQRAVPCWFARYQWPIQYCSSCEREVFTLPYDGIPDQNLRGCAECGTPIGD